MTKAEVREHGVRFGLVTAKKPESQDVCFIPDNNHTRFINEFRTEEDGDGEICTTDGTVVGHHKGYWKFTIGQRKGLGVALGKPMYVLSIDSKSNRVIIGSNEELYSSALLANRVNWFRKPREGEQLYARLRHQGILYPCEISGDDPITIRLNSPARAITPGQGVVVYSGDELIVGGWIRRVIDV